MDLEYTVINFLQSACFPGRCTSGITHDVFHMCPAMSLPLEGTMVFHVVRGTCMLQKMYSEPGFVSYRCIGQTYIHIPYIARCTTLYRIIGIQTWMLHVHELITYYNTQLG